MPSAMIRLLEDPTLDNYLRVRSALLKMDEYEPHGRDYYELQEKLTAGDFEGVVESFGRFMPNLVISPGAHWTLSMAWKELGDDGKADFEMRLGLMLAGMILQTGDGTRERPYVATRVSDEYDVLHLLEKETKSQALHLDRGSERALDVHECEDGTEVVFDITDAYALSGAELQ